MLDKIRDHRNHIFLEISGKFQLYIYDIIKKGSEIFHLKVHLLISLVQIMYSRMFFFYLFNDLMIPRRANIFYQKFYLCLRSQLLNYKHWSGINFNSNLTFPWHITTKFISISFLHSLNFQVYNSLWYMWKMSHYLRFQICSFANFSLMSLF